MKKTIVGIALSLLIAIALIACGQKTADTSHALAVAGDPISVRNAQQDWVMMTEEDVNSLQAFSAETAAKYFEEDGNVLYSPISMYYALAMATAGAEGETKDQLLSTLQMDSVDAMTEALFRHALHARTDEEGAVYSLGNSIWINDQQQDLKAPYLALMSEKLFASAYRGSFAEEAMQEAFKQEIIRGTDGKITDPVVSLTPESSTVILNTVNYNGNWGHPFMEETVDADFTDATGQTSQMTYLQDKDDFSYFQNDQYTIVDRSTSIGYVRFVLPAEGVSIDDLAKDETTLTNMMTVQFDKRAEVDMRVPKLSLHSQLEGVIEALQSLGVVDAFDPGLANFSAMSDIPQFIGDIIQEATVDFTVEGVQATAYTALIMENTSAPIEQSETLTFHLDRPFLYMIFDNANVPAFMGLYRGVQE